MTEESIPDFPQPNPYDLVGVYIRSELKKAGITVQGNGIDIPNKKFTVTTDKKVPEDIMSNLREYVENKGFTIKFLP